MLNRTTLLKTAPLLLGALLLCARGEGAAQSDQTQPSVNLSLPANELKPRIRQRVELNEAARLRFTETVVTHRLDLAMTDMVCDSSLTPSQCLTYIDGVAGAQLKLRNVSLSNLDEALKEIDASIISITTRGNDETLWGLLRTLAVQARSVISEKSRALTLSTRKLPAAVARLFRDRGISRIEFRHRVIIMANRMLIQTDAADLTKVPASGADGKQAANGAGEIVLIAPTTRDLVDMAQSLDASIEKSMQELADSVSKR